jgi:hypothetical protein
MIRLAVVAAVCDRRCLIGKFPAVTDRRYKLSGGDA